MVENDSTVELAIRTDDARKQVNLLKSTLETLGTDLKSLDSVMGIINKSSKSYQDTLKLTTTDGRNMVAVFKQVKGQWTLVANETKVLDNISKKFKETTKELTKETKESAKSASKLADSEKKLVKETNKSNAVTKEAVQNHRNSMKEKAKGFKTTKELADSEKKLSSETKRADAVTKEAVKNHRIAYAAKLRLTQANKKLASMEELLKRTKSELIEAEKRLNKQIAITARTQRRLDMANNKLAASTKKAAASVQKLNDRLKSRAAKQYEKDMQKAKTQAQQLNVSVNHLSISMTNLAKITGVFLVRRALFLLISALGESIQQVIAFHTAISEIKTISQENQGTTEQGARSLLK